VVAVLGSVPFDQDVVLALPNRKLDRVDVVAGLDLAKQTRMDPQHGRGAIELQIDVLEKAGNLTWNARFGGRHGFPRTASSDG
jgi:hypothetical protein